MTIPEGPSLQQGAPPNHHDEYEKRAKTKSQIFSILYLDFLEQSGQILYQFLFLSSLAKQLWHVVLQIGDDEGVDFGLASPLDKVVQFPHGSIPSVKQVVSPHKSSLLDGVVFASPWKILKVIKKTLELFFEKATIEIVLELLVPERADVDFRTLGHIDHL